jgi:FkbM family methyltransferase
MDTAHFLLTRFNVPMGNVPVDLGLNDDWLEHRFALFESFCLPSVLAQENKDFGWLIWIDERTPARWQSRLRADLQPLPSARVLTVKPGSQAFWQGDIERLSSGALVKRVLTTRLDNDDAISRDYLAAIRQCAAGLPHEDRHYVINYRNGCQVSHAGFFAVAERLNPFLSVVSPRNPLFTAWHSSHTDLKRFGKVVERGKFSRRPLYWLQSIHGNNVANRLQRQRARIDHRQLERFSLGQNWMKLLQNAKFIMAKGEVDLVQFAHRRLWMTQARLQERVCDVAMNGLKGEYLFENIRGAMAFDKHDLLQFLSLVLNGLAPGLMIDVGAGIGNHTLFFAKVLAADVLCVEPNPVALNLLKSNVALNGMTARVTIVEAAASDTRGTAQLQTASLLNLGATRVVQGDARGTDSIATMPLDDIMAGTAPAGKVSLIKVAVEGFENRVLRGALRIIRNDRPILVVEAVTAEALQEIEQTLRPFRYARTGPFCETTYVFGPNRWRLWRALFLRRVFRTASRLKRKIWKEQSGL